MITAIFWILMLGVFGKLLGVAFRATWGITKIIFGLIFSPVFLIILFCIGLAYIAIPVLVVLAIVLIVKSVSRV